MLAHPTVELGADTLKILVLGTRTALAHGVGVPRTQPRLHRVGILVLAELAQGFDALAPQPRRFVTLSDVVDVR